MIDDSLYIYDFSILMVSIISLIATVFNSFMLHKYKQEIKMGSSNEEIKKIIEAEMDQQFKNRENLKEPQEFNGDESDGVAEFSEEEVGNQFMEENDEDKYIAYGLVNGQKIPYSGNQSFTFPSGQTLTTDGPVIYVPHPKPRLGDNITYPHVPLHKANGGKTNVPIKMNSCDFGEESEESMLKRLEYLSSILCKNAGETQVCTPEQWEDMKWEIINQTYCLITVDLPRNKAEIIRRYFRRLDITRRKKDDTLYSVVTEGKAAKGEIRNLIKAYPWDNPDILKTYLKAGKPISGSSPLTPFGEKEDRLLNNIENLSKAVNDLKDDIKDIFK